jgi:Fe2+ or Zn2+ uptake regulation protein
VLHPAHVASVARKINRETGFHIALDHLTLAGLCESCARTAENAEPLS